MVRTGDVREVLAIAERLFSFDSWLWSLILMSFSIILLPILLLLVEKRTENVVIRLISYQHLPFIQIVIILCQRSFWLLHLTLIVVKCLLLLGSSAIVSSSTIDIIIIIIIFGPK